VGVACPDVVMKWLLVPSIAVAIAMSPSCVPVENEDAPEAIDQLSETNFRCFVEPVLIRDCSYPACHGKENRPLRVYSVGKLRAGDTATLDARNAPLTDAERRANFLSASAFTFGGVHSDDNLLLRKVMPVDTGGFEHAGGALFDGVDDKRRIAFHNWLAGDTSGCEGGTP